MQAVWCNLSLSQRSQINQGKTLFTPSLLAEIFTVAAQLKAANPPSALPCVSGFQWKGVPKFIGCRMWPRGHGAETGRCHHPPAQPAAVCLLNVVTLLFFLLDTPKVEHDYISPL